MRKKDSKSRMINLRNPPDEKTIEGFAKFWNWTQKVRLIGYASLVFAVILFYIWFEFELVEIFGDIGSIVAIILIILLFFVLLILLFAKK